MVCRDVRGGSYDVPQLLLSTPEEEKLYEIGKGWRRGFVYLASGFTEPFGHRIPRETTDRDKNGVDSGTSDVCRGGGASFVLPENGPIRRCIHPVSFPPAGEGVDVGHQNRKIAAHVPPKQKCTLQDLRRYASGKHQASNPHSNVLCFHSV